MFMEVPVTGKASLFVFRSEANHFETLSVLADNGLRPLTYREALSHSSVLVRDLKGKWFYLDETAPRKSGLYAWDENGELVEPTGNETYDQKVRAWSGKPLFSFIILDAVLSYGRFVIGNDLKPDLKALVVVGIKDAAKSLEDGRAALTRLRRGS